MAGETLEIGTTDLTDTAHITDWSGILDAPPFRGDLIELDFTAGAVWEAGEQAAYSFVVPLVMASHDPDTAVGQMRGIQALADGTEKTITRTYTSGASTVVEECQGVVTSATPVWDLTFRSKVGLILTIQVLTVWAVP